MLSQSLSNLSVATRGRGFYDITQEIQKRVAESGFHTGLCTLLNGCYEILCSSIC